MTRQQTIDHVLEDLQELKNSGSFRNSYALNENIAFFESIKSFPKYIKWLFTRVPKLN